MSEFNVNRDQVRLQQCDFDPTLVEISIVPVSGPPLLLRFPKQELLRLCKDFLENYADEVR